MRLPFKKQEEASSDTSAVQKPRSYDEFIPYYAHYNDHTLVTKNGELLQVISITSNNLGLNYESGENSNDTVRALIRRALRESIGSDAYAISIHTLRKRRPVQHSSDFTQPFAAHVYEQWQEKNHWKHQYYNEIYITLIHEGQTAPIIDTLNLKQVWLPSHNRAFRNRYLAESAQALDTVTQQVMQKIGAHYQARRLSIVERLPHGAGGPGVFYSEALEFLNTLVNLRHEEIPISDIDIGQLLAPQTLLVGFNAIETKDSSGSRRFGALLSLKQYRELPPETADRIMQLPVELIVSQNFTFVDEAEALKEYKEQKWLFSVSGDDYSENASGLQEMLDENRGTPVDYGKQQTTIMVVTDEYRQLDSEIRRLQEAFAEVGLITIREDIRLEECYWSMLPGNFEFIRRQETLPSSKIAGFARLNRFPQGNDQNLHWNDPLALVPTSVNSPYFFNFHHQDNGHTLMLDFNSFGDNVGITSLDFLITMGLKYRGHVYLFDRHRHSRLFAQKLDAPYHRMVLPRQPAIRHPLKLNPFAMAESRRNQSFLAAWCQSLLPPDIEPTETQKSHIAQAVAEIFSLPPSQRHFLRWKEILADIDSSLAALFNEFTEGGQFAGLFDAPLDMLSLPAVFTAFDMDLAVAEPRLTIPLFSYFMHRIIDSLDGKPTLIVVHDALALFENRFFAPRLESLLEMLTQNNAALVATLPQPQRAEGSKTLAALLHSCATRLYIPDDIATDYTAGAAGLSEQDNHLMQRMQRNMGDMLVKQASETVGVRINLDHMEDIKAIYGNDVKNLIAAGGRFASLPPEE